MAFTRAEVLFLTSGGAKAWLAGDVIWAHVGVHAERSGCLGQRFRSSTPTGNYLAG